MRQLTLARSLTLLVAMLTPSAGLAEAIWWTDSAAGTVGTAALDGSNPTDVLTGLDLPQGLALDLVHNHIYWVESDAISRANLDGSSVQQLVTGLDTPHGIALHLAGGKMYWTHRGGVSRANLIGSNIQSVVAGLPDPPPQHIAIDVVNQQLYWADSQMLSGQIHTAGLTGAGHTILTEFEAEVATPIGMAVNITGAGGHIYWTDGTGKVTRADEQAGNIVNLIDAGLSGPGDIALHVAAGQMYFADRFDIKRTGIDGSNPVVLVDGLSRGQGMTIAVDPPGLQPPVLTAPLTDACPDDALQFCGQLDVRFVLPLNPGDPLAFNLHPAQLVRDADLFDTLVVEIDGRVVAELVDYIPGEVLPLTTDHPLDPDVAYRFSFRGELNDAYAGITELGVDVISPSLIPEPGTLAMLVTMVFVLTRRPASRGPGDGSVLTTSQARVLQVNVAGGG